MKRELFVIARDIRKDWKNPSPHAIPYIDAMEHLRTVEDNFFFDSGKEIVLRFLSNASTWRGEIARKIKKELKSLVNY